MTLEVRGKQAMSTGAALCVAGLVAQFLPDPSYRLFEIGVPIVLAGAGMIVVGGFLPARGTAAPVLPDPVAERDRQSDLQSTRNFSGDG